MEAVELLTEVRAKREAAAAAWEAVSEDVRSSARAVRAESVQARQHARMLLRDAAALVARAERSVAEARDGAEARRPPRTDRTA